MANTVKPSELIARYPLISDQINRDQLLVILHELARALDRNPDGDIVEFGCYIGATSLFISRLLEDRKASRAFHVYDSFTGLPAKTGQDQSRAGEQFQAGELAVSKKQFLLEFKKANLRPPIVHKGWFGELTGQDVPTRIAFAFLDGDFYDSIRDSLHLVLPHLTAQATIVIDDYAREALPGVARAVQHHIPASLQAKLKVQQNLAIIRCI